MSIEELKHIRILILQIWKSMQTGTKFKMVPADLNNAIDALERELMQNAEPTTNVVVSDRQ